MAEPTQPKTYIHETAGELMVGRDKIPVVTTGTTLSEVKSLLVNKTTSFVSIDYIYVTDKENHLVGAFSVKELFQDQKTNEKVEDIMHKEVYSVRAHTHQEKVALLALRRNIKSVPVIDKSDYFLGVIPFDVILKVLDKEAVEDLLRFGGIYHHGSYDDLMSMTTIQSLKHRLPWLLLGLLGGFLTVGIISNFEQTLSQNLVLAAFIPLVIYMASAVGTQMEAFIIREMAVNPTLSFFKYFVKQMSVVFLIALVTSTLLAVISSVFYGNTSVSITLGIAMFLAILSSIFTGLIIPYLFGKLKMDPANASGPVATIVQDTLSVFVYFVVASFIL